MKLLIPVFLFVFLFSFINAKAQQPHFIYIQTENKQPFYVKLDNTIYNSTESGYVIISKLLDSIYNFTVGFSKNEWPQQNFSCTINKKDEGYVLKNFGDKGWALFNLESMDVIMATTSADEKNIVKEERTDSFSNMLSAVVHDPSIKQKEIVKPEINKDTVAIDTFKTQVAVVNTPTEIIAKSTVTKISQNINSDGAELVYFDNDNKDTIKLFIPADKIALSTQPKEVEKITPVAEVQNTNSTIATDTTLKVITASKAKLDTITPLPNQTKKIIADDSKVKITANTNGCKNFASEEDFLKLRKKMASADTDDDMIGIAKKVFKLKCFATSQIRNLGFLFLKDEGKYKFFDMAYSFVSDPENFDSLQSELSDEYYINRFKVMVKH
jgi:hypothetical protein